MLSDRLQNAIASELDHSERLINLGLAVERRVLILGALADGELSLGNLTASSEIEMIARIGALVTGAMLNAGAREFVLTEPLGNGTFATYAVSRRAHAGLTASQIAPFDEGSVQFIRWSDPHAALLQAWIPAAPTLLDEASIDVWQAMHDVAPGGPFEVKQIGSLTSGFNAECGTA